MPDLLGKSLEIAHVRPCDRFRWPQLPYIHTRQTTPLHIASALCSANITNNARDSFRRNYYLDSRNIVIEFAGRIRRYAIRVHGKTRPTLVRQLTSRMTSGFSVQKGENFCQAMICSSRTEPLRIRLSVFDHSISTTQAFYIPLHTLYTALHKDTNVSKFLTIKKFISMKKFFILR